MFEYITDASKIDQILLKNRASYSAYAGYFCSYFPVELLYGFNIHPVRILGYAQHNVQKRDLINYMCAYLTDVISSFESGHYSWADRLIVPATCDSLYGAKEYLENTVDNVKTKMFRLPLKFTPDTYPVYRNAVEDVMEWLDIDYSYDDRLLREALEANNKVNRRIMDLLSGSGAIFMGSLYLKLMMARSVLPYPDMMSVLDEVNSEAVQKNYTKDKPNVLILGPICDNLDLIDYINTEYNVIARFMTSSLGLYDSEVSLEGDIKDNLIRHYFSRAGTVTSSDYYSRFIKELDQEIQEHAVKGAIYLNYQYCDPHMFFSKRIKDHLQNTDMKVLYLELEHAKGMDAMLQNRIDAFMENI